MKFYVKVLVRDVATYIEKIAPISLACEWDNVGLIIGNYDRVVKRIVVCLDLTREVLDFCYEKMKESVTPRFTEQLSNTVSKITNRKI